MVKILSEDGVGVIAPIQNFFGNPNFLLPEDEDVIIFNTLTEAEKIAALTANSVLPMQKLGGHEIIEPETLVPKEPPDVLQFEDLWAGEGTPHVINTTTMTAAQLEDNFELAKLASNLAISRGISPNATWLWGVRKTTEEGQGIAGGVPVIDYIQNDAGWKRWLATDDYTSPEGITYSYEEVLAERDALRTAYEAAIAKVDEILNMSSEDQLAALKQYFPELYVMPQRAQDGTGRALTNYGVRFIQPEDVTDILLTYLDQRKAEYEDFMALVGKALPDEKDIDAFVRQMYADPTEMLDILHNSPDKTAAKALLEAAFPEIDENTIRYYLGQVPKLSYEEWLKASPTTPGLVQMGIIGQSYRGIPILSEAEVKAEFYETYVKPGFMTQAEADAEVAKIMTEYYPSIEAKQKAEYQKYLEYMDSWIMTNKVSRSVQAGFYSAAGGIGGGINFIGQHIAMGDTWLGKGGIADNLSQIGLSGGGLAVVDLDPTKTSWEDIYTGFFEAAPLTVALLIGGFVTASTIGAVGSALGLGALGTFILSGIGGGSARLLGESAVEAGATYDACLKLHPGDAIGAKAAADKVWIWNAPLSAWDMLQFGISFIGGGTAKALESTVLKGLVNVARNPAGKIIALTFTEGGEEVYQELVTMNFLGDKRGLAEKLKDPAIFEVYIIGGAMGMGMGGGASIYTSIQDRYIKSLPAKSQEVFNQAKENAIMEGKDEAEAKKAAIEVVASTPEGAKVAKALAETIKVELESAQLNPKNPADRVALDNAINTRKKLADPEGIVVEPIAKVEPVDLQALHDANPVLFNTAERSGTVDEFINKMSGGKVETVNTEVLTDFYNKVKAEPTIPRPETGMPEARQPIKTSIISKVSEDYYLARYKEGEVYYDKVVGKPVTIEGYEGYDFFIHRPYDVIDKVQSTKDWVISEGETGQALTGYLKTQKEAITEAKFKLDKNGGKSNLDRIIKSVVESKQGVTPRYDAVKGGGPGTPKKIAYGPGATSAPYFGGAKVEVSKPSLDEIIPLEAPPTITPGPMAENVIGLRTITPNLTRSEVAANLAKRTLNFAFDKVGIQPLSEADPMSNAALNERARVRQNAESVSKAIGLKLTHNLTEAFNPDSQGRIAKLSGVNPDIVGAPTIQDVAARLPEYRDSLTKPQLDALAEAKEALTPYRKLLEEVGVEIPSRPDVMEGGFYLPRGRANLEGADNPVKVGGGRKGIKKGFERPTYFPSMAHGIVAGYEYASLGDTLTFYCFDASTRAIDAHVANFFKALTDDSGRLLGETVKQRLERQEPELMKKVNQVNERLTKLKRNLVSLDKRTLDVIDLWQHDPDFTDIDTLLDGLATMRAGKENLARPEIIEQIDICQEYLRELKPDYKKALRRAEVTPREQGVIILPALQGRTYPNELANAANQILTKEGKTVGALSSVVNTVNAYNNLYRGVRATLDNSALGIQGLLGMYGSPTAYYEALKVNIRAWGIGGDKILGTFINEFDSNAQIKGRLTSAEWAKAGLRLGGSLHEFQLGAGVGEKISELLVVRQANRAFGYFGDALRLEWADNQLHTELRKGRSFEEIRMSGDMERIANGANVMTGWSRGKAFGSLGDLALFAPRWLQSRLETLGKAVMGMRPGATLDQRMARNSIIKMIGFGIIMTILMNMMQGEETDFRPIVNGRRNNKFLRIKLGGAYFSLFGSWDSLLGLFVNTATGKPLLAVKSISSGIVSNVWDIITGRDYNYEPVTDTPAHFAVWALKNFIPFGIGQIPEGVELIQRGQTAGGLASIFGEFIGIKSYPEADWDSIASKSGLPIYPDDTLLASENPVYTTKMEYADTLAKLGSTTMEEVIGNKDYPDRVRSIAETKTTLVEVNLLRNTTLDSLSRNSEFLSLWQDRSGITDHDKSVIFDTDLRKKYNISQSEYVLLNQYLSLKDEATKEKFLKDHLELETNPRESYLTTHAQENALLALWGQADLFSKAAYTALRKLQSDLDIPDSALSNKIPTTKVATSYYKWLDIVNKYTATDPEAKLLRLNDPDLEKWGETNLNWDPITDDKTSLQIHVDYRAQFELYAGYANPEAPNYNPIGTDGKSDPDGSTRKAAYMKANPVFESKYWLAYALDLTDKNGSHMPYNLAIKYVAYKKATNGTTYRRTNPDLNSWMVNAKKWQPLS